jgi:predicted ATP-dependent protease
MPTTELSPEQLRLTIAPASLGFVDTAELLGLPVPWIGQQRAEQAARFGLNMTQADYHLFVLGEVGSGRSSLMGALAREVAATRAVPPDLCYLHNFDAPERPHALRMPPGQGQALRQLMQQLCRTLEQDIPQRLGSEAFKAESERIQAAYKDEEARAFAALETFAEQRGFHLFRESGHLVFTLMGEDGHALTADQARALPRERRQAVEQAEQELREAITQFLEKTRPMARTTNEALVALRRQVVKPLLEHELQDIRRSLLKQIKDAVKLNRHLDRVQQDVLEHVELFVAQDSDDEDRQEALEQLLRCYQVNVVVDNAALQGAPVIVEDNPVSHALFGGIDYQADEDVLLTDFTHVRAGSLLRAHGGFLLLHLRDVLADPSAWERLRRYLRSGRVQIEESSAAQMPMTAVTLRPEAVDAEVKLVLIGSTEQYYALQEGDPEIARRFRVKVDFAESFSASHDTRQATAIFMAHCSRQHGLPPLSAAAVARLLEDTHREVDDQTRQSAIFARTEALVAESAALCRARAGLRVEDTDVAAALQARRQRHSYPEERLRASIAEGEQIISVHGVATGQINGLTQIDLGDWRFGLPIRVSARTWAGSQGLLNIEREVELSGPIHDKGVLILHSYLSVLFAQLAPLALSASIVFEQEYHGVEGDSASCAELYALLSSLSGIPLRQGIAVTGALNQHGEVLPVGGINEKIEGWFRVCQAQGLDGQQGVLVPARNRRHLMLDPEVVQAVQTGRFHIHTTERVIDGLALLTGVEPGLGSTRDTGGGEREPSQTPYPPETVLGKAWVRLQAFRRACQRAARPSGPGRGR